MKTTEKDLAMAKNRKKQIKKHALTRQAEANQSLQPIRHALSEFRKLTDLVIPPKLSGSTDVTRLDKARRDYDTTEHAGQTITEILRGYERNEVLGKKMPKPGRTESTALTRPEALQEALSRSSMEMYRASKGLNKVRDKLKEGLIKSISFDEGIRKILTYVTETGRLRERLHELLTWKRGEKIVLDDIEKVALCFPDITAEEVAWLSIAQIERVNLAFGVPAPFFYPATIVDMDMDGLLVAFGTIDETVEHSSRAMSEFQLAGIAGTSAQYQLVPYEFNVHQAIKAIVLLSIDDGDLLRRIWQDHDETPIRRGDAALAKAILKGSSTEPNVPWDLSLDQLRQQGYVSRNDIDKAREELRDYAASNLVFLDSPVQTILDLLRLVGMLERAPNFIEAKKPFRGYLKLFGAAIEFISEDGVIVDTVSLHEHVLLTTSYKFHDQLTDISRRNKVATKLFAEMKDAVYHVIVDQERQMSLDECQSRIFDAYRVFIPATVIMTSRPLNALDMIRGHLKIDEIVERTMKFGRLECQILEGVLKLLPKGMLTNVRSITKELSHSNTLASLRGGGTHGGRYHKLKQQIVICLPIETPKVEHGLFYLLEMIMGHSSAKRSSISSRAKLELHKAYFIHVLLHEIGESLWATLPKELMVEWIGLTPGSGSIKSRYLTPYARESVSEDFCETFAVFFTHGATFRKRASRHPVLAAKYAFVKKAWSMDGQTREFHDMDEVSLVELHGQPDDDPTRQMLEEELREEYMGERWSDDHERTYFSRHVMSYEELAEEALEDEAEVNPFDKAARKHRFTESDEQREELFRRHSIVSSVRAKTTLMLEKIKIHDIDLPERVYDCLREGNVAEVERLLRKAGGKPKRAVVQTARSLCALHQAFAEDLVMSPDELDSIKEGNEQIARTIDELVQWDASLKKRQNSSDDKV